MNDEDAEFWMSASEESLHEIWDNDEDDVYAELLTPSVMIYIHRRGP